MELPKSRDSLYVTARAQLSEPATRTFLVTPRASAFHLLQLLLLERPVSVISIKEGNSRPACPLLTSFCQGFVRLTGSTAIFLWRWKTRVYILSEQRAAES